MVRDAHGQEGHATELQEVERVLLENEQLREVKSTTAISEVSSAPQEHLY